MISKLHQNLWEKAVTEFWLSNQKYNLERFLLSFTLLLLPTQFGRHFWPDFAFVQGQRSDYLSPTIYFTDIFITLLLLIWFARSCLKKDILETKLSACCIGFLNKFPQSIDDLKIAPKRNALLSVFLIFITILGIILSQNPLAGLYGLLRMIEFVLFGFYIANFFEIRHFTSLRGIRQLADDAAIQVFSLGVLFESLLAIFQFVTHKSLGGVFYFLGERAFNAQTPGIANASMNGALVLRPYGTFSHPNVLAGYLLISMIIIISNFKFQIPNFKYSDKLSIKYRVLSIKTLFPFIVLGLGTIVLFLTLSRVAIILWLLIIGFLVISHYSKKILNTPIRGSKYPWGTRYQILNTILKIRISLTFFLTGLVIGGILITPFLRDRFLGLSLGDESIVSRVSLFTSAISMIATHPFFGVGLNNFLPALPFYSKTNGSVLLLQPVHNIFLLLASEIGLVGFGICMWFLYLTIRHAISVHARFLLIALLSICILGMFDHYFLTLQQGQMLLALVLGLCWSI